MTENQIATLERLRREQVAFPPLFAVANECIRVMIVTGCDERRAGPLLAMDLSLPLSFDAELIEISPHGVATTIERATYQLGRVHST